MMKSLAIIELKDGSWIVLFEPLKYFNRSIKYVTKNGYREGKCRD